MFAQYDDPAQMEPLLVSDENASYPALIGLAHELSEASARLDASLAPATARSLSRLVSGMNCYYTNLIEGHHTLPVDIEKAMSAPSDNNNLRSLAFAHIQSDQWAKTQTIDANSLLAFLLELHQRFAEHLPDNLKIVDAGKIRKHEVRVGRHVAPLARTVPAFLERFAKVYTQQLEWSKKGGISKLSGVLAAIAAHHRLVWVHPFSDGNGRVARIVLDAMLRECGINMSGLWSISRGFAKSADDYKARLANADQPRMGDLDGRGSLSEKRLVEFCEYTLHTAIDQARFMGQMFSLENFRFRTEQYFQKVRFDLKPESSHLFLHAFVFGSFERMAAGRITGLPERTARDVSSTLIQEGFLVSDSPRGKLRVGFPVHALSSLLPNLYPAGDLDSAQKQAQDRKAKAIPNAPAGR